MYTFFLVLLILDSIVLVTAILLQAGKGNGLAATFGGVSSSADSLLGTRQAGNLLTKTSWWGGALFLLLSLILSIASTHQRAPRSVLDQAFQPATTAPATTTPAGGAAGAGAAGIPLTPAPSTSAPATSGSTAPSSSAPAGQSAPAPAAPTTTTP